MEGMDKRVMMGKSACDDAVKEILSAILRLGSSFRTFIKLQYLA